MIEKDFQDDLTAQIELEPISLGIPSEIKVTAPKIPNVKLVHDIPTNIKLDVPDIPNIKLDVPENLPKNITFDNIPDIPKAISINAIDLPNAIKLEANIPEAIQLNVPENFPTSILLDASEIPESIQVTGIPESIELKHDLPEEIMLRLPEDIEVPLVYKGGPVPLQLNMEAADGEAFENCFALVPCNKK